MNRLRMERTGANRDNRVWTVSRTLFSPSPLFALTAMEVDSINKANLFGATKLLNIHVGLIINFHELKLTNGLSSLIHPGTNRK
jgi:hypothetical protein